MKKKILVIALLAAAIAMCMVAMLFVARRVHKKGGLSSLLDPLDVLVDWVYSLEDVHIEDDELRGDNLLAPLAELEGEAIVVLNLDSGRHRIELNGDSAGDVLENVKAAYTNSGWDCAFADDRVVEMRQPEESVRFTAWETCITISGKNGGRDTGSFGS
ncbi:hypothetical protein KQI84_18410 [bacterium]|nr:hypothetical protein [bacterium]